MEYQVNWELVEALREYIYSYMKKKSIQIIDSNQNKIEPEIFSDSLAYHIFLDASMEESRSKNVKTKALKKD